jgi:hypothetical protein
VIVDRVSFSQPGNKPTIKVKDYQSQNAVSNAVNLGNKHSFLAQRGCGMTSPQYTQLPDGTWQRIDKENRQEEKSAGNTAKASFHLTSLSDLLKEPDEDIAYLWQDTLIKGGLSILVAKPKVGKSTLARNLAYALAKGEPSFLRKNITGSGPIVYLALEEKRSQVKKHFERMGATENLPIFIHTGSPPEQAIEGLRKAAICPIYKIWGYKPGRASNPSLGYEALFLASLLISPQRKLQPDTCNAHITSRMTRMQVKSIKLHSTKYILGGPRW